MGAFVVPRAGWYEISYNWMDRDGLVHEGPTRIEFMSGPVEGVTVDGESGAGSDLID